jgi:CHAT domain-containing protein
MSWQSGDLGRSGLNFARLPGTRLEGKRIAELLHAQLFLDKEALERSFKKVRSLRLLHIASHGFFLTRFSSARASGSGNGLISITDHDSLRFLGTALENPLLRSGLALAGANK